MPKSYQVQIAVSGVAQAAQQVKSVATATQQVAAANQKLAQQVAASNSSFVRMSSSVSALRVPSGPAQRLASAQVSAYHALQVGSPAQVFDTQAALQKAQSAYQKVASPAGPAAPAAAPSIGSRFASAVYSSRFGMGGGVMPLVGQTANALGINLRGMLAAPAGMAASAIIALGVAASKAAEHVDQLARQAFLSGGSAGQVGGLQRFGIGDVAGAAGGLRSRTSGGDPFAMMAAQHLGVGIPLPRPFGGTNEAQYYRQVADALRNVHDKEEQLRLVRMLGVPEMEHLLRVSEGVYQAVNRIDAPAQTQIYDAATGQASADATTGLQRAGGAIEDVFVAVFKPLIPIVSLVTNSFANVGEGMASIIDLITGPVTESLQWLASGIGQIFTPIFGGFMHLIHWLRWFEKDPIGTLTGKHASELDENTSALNQNTAAMKAGIHGGGPRLAGAMPGNLRGEALRQMMNAGQVRLGAF